MREYEIMLILPAEVDDKVIGGVTDRISQVLGEHGGQLGAIDRWGRRRFAYAIDKRSEGFYLVARFTAEPDGLKELDRVLSLADDVIRFKVVVRPPGAAALAAPAPMAAAEEVGEPAAEPEPAPERAEPESSATEEPEPAPEEAEQPAAEAAGAPSTGAA
jgi:small subunit ribosomal protein S6